MADEVEIVMHPVVSSRVKALGYDVETKTLRAEFPNGRLADYEGVPEEAFHQVMSAGSVGVEFGAVIVNGGYPHKYV